jgi:hypothetical protein
MIVVFMFVIVVSRATIVDTCLLAPHSLDGEAPSLPSLSPSPSPPVELSWLPAVSRLRLLACRGLPSAAAGVGAAAAVGVVGVGCSPSPPAQIAAADAALRDTTHTARTT